MKRVPGRGPAALSSPSRSQGPADTAQVVSSPGEFPAAARALERVRAEYVVRVAGTLRLRKDPNPQLPTGAVELLAEEARCPARRTPGCAPPRMHGRSRARRRRTAAARAPSGRQPAWHELHAPHAWPLPARVDSRGEIPTARQCRRGLGPPVSSSQRVDRPSSQRAGHCSERRRLSGMLRAPGPPSTARPAAGEDGAGRGEGCVDAGLGLG